MIDMPNIYPHVKSEKENNFCFRFGESDSEQNIIFEEREKSSGVPIIKETIVTFSRTRITISIFFLFFWGGG